MNYSFYGGQKGTSFLLTGRFASVQEMVAAFKQGGNYTTINYDEYVIIDTENKNDPDNGKIYRRGYEYTNTLGGAQYIGCVVGPGGLAPQVKMSTIQDIRALQEEEGFEYRYSSGAYSPINGLVAGKTPNGSFNDEIRWACCSVRDENNKDCIAYIGFTFPYHVIDYVGESVSPYYHRDSEEADFINLDLTERMDAGLHPFYEQWKIFVPKGIKGDSFKNLHVIDVNRSDGVEPYGGQQHDYEGKQNMTFEHENAARQIIVYDYYKYDKKEEGEKVSLYLGDFNMISNIAFDDDGTLRVAYTHNDDSVWTNKVKWITDMSLTQNGKLTVNFNYGETDTQYSNTLEWIDKVNFKPDGTITLTYNDHEEEVEDFCFPNLIQWITGIDLSTDGTFTFSYNNGTPDSVFTKVAKWINNITLADDGTLTINYNNGAVATVFDKKIKWITGIDLTDSGTLTVSYNNGTTPSAWANKLKWITDVRLANNGTLSISYNNGTPDTDFTKALQWITDVQVQTDGTLNIIYNNDAPTTSFNKLIKWIDTVAVADNGTITISYNNGAASKVIDKKVKWINNVTLSDNGLLTISFNNGSTDITKQLKWIKNCEIKDGQIHIFYNDNTQYTTGLPWLKNISVNELTQKLHIEYFDGTEQDIGSALNYIQQMIIHPDTYHLLVLYSDPENVGTVTYQGIAGWHDLGSVQSYTGSLCGDMDATGAPSADLQIAAQAAPTNTLWFITEELPVWEDNE